MEEKEDIKIEELFSYGMSKEGFQKLLLDIETSINEGKAAIDCTKILEDTSISEEDKTKLNEAVTKANKTIDISYKEIEDLFKRILSDWEKEKGDTNE